MGISEHRRWYAAWQDGAQILLLKHLSKIKQMATVQGGSTNAGVNPSLVFGGRSCFWGPFPPLQVAEGLGAVFLADLPL